MEQKRPNILCYQVGQCKNKQKTQQQQKPYRNDLNFVCAVSLSMAPMFCCVVIDKNSNVIRSEHEKQKQKNKTKHIPKPKILIAMFFKSLFREHILDSGNYVEKDIFLRYTLLLRGFVTWCH